MPRHSGKALNDKDARKIAAHLKGKINRTSTISSARPSGNLAVTRFSSHQHAHASEKKVIDYNFTAAYALPFVPATPNPVLHTNTSNASIAPLNNIEQGTSVSQRTGNKIKLRSLKYRFTLLAQAGAFLLTVPTYCRFMILYDHAPNGVLVNTNVILGDHPPNAVIANNGDFTSSLNPQFFDRFTILKDDMLVLPPYDSTGAQTWNALAATNPDNFTWSGYVPLKNLETCYNGNATPPTIAQITTGALLIMTIGSQAAATQPWVIYGKCRLRFTDN